MTPDPSLLAFLVVGMLGVGHCAGMCGGIVGALSVQGGGRISLHLAYSAGRIASYSAAGTLAGSIGGFGLLLDHVLPVQVFLYASANILLVLLGLYLAGLATTVTRLESLGRALWTRLHPAARRLLPADTLPRALALGAVWGWLPCGLVYSVLATALFAGSPLKGATLMASFGLGTLPALLAAGVFAHRVARISQAKWLRFACGTLVLGLGVSGLARALDLGEKIRAGILCLG
jgi:sulfite exporter TauE/SafE